MSRTDYKVPGFWKAAKAAHDAKERERARSIERRVLKRAFRGFVEAAKAALAGEKGGQS